MDMELNWYALRVRSRHEKAAAERLSEKYEIYLPLIREYRKWSDRVKRVEIPLFSGYLFIRTEVRMKYYILEDRAVSGFVQFGKAPAVIHENEINAIRKMLLEPETLKVEEGYRFTKGEKVTVSRGAFAGIRWPGAGYQE
ncbi:MAG: transcription termination/antitermination NusG family protein [Candidatus Marinimicrobia bacterium]|nr:transcription termination/antitermination NusG family protein [Candidatus Neomarinimicrobiota bacterium]